jgi:CHAD domain-containing protein
VARWRFAAVIEGTLKEWRSARRRVLRRHAGKSAVHAWRICSRQLLALEQLLGPDAQKGRRASLSAELHRAFRASGKLRDSQLAIPRFEALALNYPPAAKLARHLRRQLPQQRQKVLRRVRSITPRKLRRLMKAWGNPRTMQFEHLARHRAVRRLAHAARLPTTPDLVRQTAPSLHRRRIHLKSLRYMTDLCRASGCDISQCRVPIGKMARLQSGLGEVMDIQVLLQHIEAYGRRHERWRSEAAPLRLHLRNHRRRLIGRLPRQESKWLDQTAR